MSSFIEAGAELIETNTFGANRDKLAQHYLEDDFEPINSAGVKLARDAREITGREVFIGASIGPAGERSSATFADQARILEGRGADVVMLETFYNLVELELAVEAVRSVTSLPDRRADELRQRRRDAGGRLGAGSRRAISVSWNWRRSARITAAGRPRRSPRSADMAGGGAVLAALPNVGLATFVGPRVAFPHATPEYFAEFAARARGSGAQLIGGCCGTTPRRGRCNSGGRRREPLCPSCAART